MLHNFLIIFFSYLVFLCINTLIILYIHASKTYLLPHLFKTSIPRFQTIPLPRIRFWFHVIWGANPYLTHLVSLHPTVKLISLFFTIFTIPFFYYYSALTYSILIKTVYLCLFGNIASVIHLYKFLYFLTVCSININRTNHPTKTRIHLTMQ